MPVLGITLVLALDPIGFQQVNPPVLRGKVFASLAESICSEQQPVISGQREVRDWKGFLTPWWPRRAVGQLDTHV